MDRDDRRDFLKTAGVLAAGALTASVAGAKDGTTSTLSSTRGISTIDESRFLSERLPPPDVDILNRIKSQIKGDTVPASQNFVLSPASADAITSYTTMVSDLKLPPLPGVEAAYTRRELAPWIRPFHFELNLNSALDALDDSESLLNDIRTLNLVRLQINHEKATIPASDADAKNRHEATVGDLALSEYNKNLRVRLTQRIIDLIEYTKAARYGAKVLFGIESNELTYESDNNVAVSTFRESLRRLLESYRGIVAKDQELVIPISLRHAKAKNSQPLVPRWKAGTDAEARPTDQLGVENLELWGQLPISF